MATVAGLAGPGLGLARETPYAPGYDLAEKPNCQPGDRVETGLQGQVPHADRTTGRAAQGYSCNLTLLGEYGSVASDPAQSRMTGWATLDSYKHCGYHGDGNDAVGEGQGGIVVIDASDPTKPKQTDYLITGAMRGPWESLRVNLRRGLLVADHQNSGQITGDAPGASPLDIYDISQDCTKPKLLFSGNMPTGVGHEGWVTPDGTVYYMSGGSSLVPVDISDPTKPKELGTWELSIHGGSTSEDGTRSYLCNNGPDGLMILDTASVSQHKPTPEPKIVGEVSFPDNFACQATYAVTYGGHPYVIQYGEAAADVTRNCADGETHPTFSYPRLIDIADEKNPKVVAGWLTEVKLPENCPQVTGDRSQTLFNSVAAKAVYGIFIYDTHHCTPDRLQDPTVLACAEFLSGLRVYDIRDPFNVREIAYWNNGTLMPGSPTVDFSASPPRLRPDRGEVWFNTDFGGLKILKFADGAYPFKETLTCPTRPDWVFALYNRNTACPVAAGEQNRPATICERVLHIAVRQIVGSRMARRLTSATVYVNGKRFRRLRGSRALRTPLVIRGLTGKRVRVGVTGRQRGGKAVRRTVTRNLCHAA